MIGSEVDGRQLTRCIITIMSSRCVIITALLVGLALAAVVARSPVRDDNSGGDDDCLDSTEGWDFKLVKNSFNFPIISFRAPKWTSM